MTTASLRMRLAPTDSRYAGELIPGSKALELFADLETELSLLEGGNEGLCAGYEMVEFLAPLHVGDFVEARAHILSRGRTSRRVQAELYKVLSAGADGLAVYFDQPVLAARAIATIVVGPAARHSPDGRRVPQPPELRGDGA
jgi:3-aminobutyryl-CoA ammonia-lyase